MCFSGDFLRKTSGWITLTRGHFLTTEPLPEITEVHHINFSVYDLKKSAAWYKEVFGLTNLWELEDPDGYYTKVNFRPLVAGCVL